MLIALVRMGATFRVLSQTADEQTHVGAGLELFQQQTYGLHRDNPPLPRVVMAIAPWLGGMRIDLSDPDYSRKLHSVIYGLGGYKRNMVLIRCGNLLFFALGAWALWAWARSETDDATAFLAVLFFTMQPIVLGYSALATHDIAATAGVAVALLAFSSWLRERTSQRAVIFGLAYGFAILCKFSCIPFVALPCIAIAIVRRRSGAPWPPGAQVSIALLVAILSVWAGYAFTIGRLGDIGLIADGYGRTGKQFILDHQSLPLPAPAFFWGIASMLRQNRDGFLCYFFGHASREGWLVYFPAAIALKSTLAFLALLAAGGWFARREPAFVESIAASAAIVGAAMTSKLDLGVRYVLPVYVPLSLAAAVCTVALIRRSARNRNVAFALIAIHCGVSLAAHPDYFPFFNVIAARDPSYFLIDSNLDWGQDVLRLRSELRKRRIEAFGHSLMGGADLDALEFPRHRDVSPWAIATGWIAISDHSYRMQQTQLGWAWLEREPYTRVGKSIRLYDLSPKPATRSLPPR